MHSLQGPAQKQPLKSTQTLCEGDSGANLNALAVGAGPGGILSGDGDTGGCHFHALPLLC